ncbi:hypothetical protein Pfo_010206 [Paulownia fortunei]|nr:hypothetical protein Pfo_010206 [Paulownia fortunei]
MAIRFIFTTFAIMALASSLVYASDPSPLQDFCVAVNDSKASVFVNGKICKNPNMVTADDFFFSGLNKPGNTSNQLGSKVTAVTVNQLAGLKTLSAFLWPVLTLHRMASTLLTLTLALLKSLLLSKELYTLDS